MASTGETVITALRIESREADHTIKKILFAYFSLL
jgi:hypothetical protein